MALRAKGVFTVALQALSPPPAGTPSPLLRSLSSPPLFPFLFLQLQRGWEGSGSTRTSLATWRPPLWVKCIVVVR
jgi:hypothetical protein